jgi:hypothetical protein
VFVVVVCIVGDGRKVLVGCGAAGRCKVHEKVDKLEEKEKTESG